jgi:hypothetical protein
MANEIINDDLYGFKESSLNTISPNENENKYIYLLRDHEEIYKVGKTKQKNLSDFSNDSNVVLCILSNDCDNKLKRILKINLFIEKILDLNILKAILMI